MNRRYYELCALSELENALRSGDIWMQGSRQFKDFDEYPVQPPADEHGGGEKMARCVSVSMLGFPVYSCVGGLRVAIRLAPTLAPISTATMASETATGT